MATGIWKLAFAAMLALAADAIAAERLPSAWESDPAVPPRAILHEAPDGLLPLWLTAISVDDADAELLAQVASGMIRLRRLEIAIDPQTSDRIIDVLAGKLGRGDFNRSMTLAVANALVEFNASRHAGLIAAQLPVGGRDLAAIIEPALAQWGDRTLLQTWRQRLDDPGESPQLRLLAVRAARALGDETLKPSLLRIALRAQDSPALRLAAAESLAEIDGSDLATHARRLIDEARPQQLLAQLVALRMVSQSQGPEVEELLKLLADSNQPTVAAAATARLLAVQPASGQQRREKLFRHPDYKVRLLGARSVVEHQPTLSDVALLTAALADDHINVRQAACEALVAISDRPELADEIRAVTARRLDPALPVQTEQALQVLAKIDATTSAAKVADLLSAADPRVSVTSAWALERLATPTQGDQIYARLVAEVRRTSELVRDLARSEQPQGTTNNDPTELDDAYRRIEHLIVALGRLGYQPASEFLLRFVPKPQRDPDAPPAMEAFYQLRPRAAAIWSLGKIYAGQRTEAPQKVVEALTDRMSDSTPVPAEEPLVRSASAFSLGRIGAPQSLAAINDALEFIAPESDLQWACNWAIHQINGKPIAPRSDQVVRHADWFLAPRD